MCSSFHQIPQIHWGWVLHFSGAKFCELFYFCFRANHTSDLPVKEEGPPRLARELRSSHLSVSFPLVKPQSRLLKESEQTNENVPRSSIRKPSKALLKKFKRNEFETQEGINFGDSDTKYWSTSVSIETFACKLSTMYFTS